MNTKTKKYILVQNDEEIDILAFNLIGASTKRDDDNKIGFFGSGLKYSLAYALRNNIEIKIFSGEKEVEVSTKTINFRGKDFNVICINDIETSFTSSMGPTWEKDWFIIREIWSNAKDENNAVIIPSTEIVQGVKNKTRIYIEITENLKKVVENWDNYFSEDLTPLFSIDNLCTSYLSSKFNRQRVDVYNKKGVIYRKGIKVHEDDRLKYSYNFIDTDINEDRTLSQSGALYYPLVNIIAQFPSEAFILDIIQDLNLESLEYFSLSLGISGGTTFSPKWIDFSKKYNIVGREIAGHYKEELLSSKKEIIQLPLEFLKELKSRYPEFIIFGSNNFFEKGVKIIQNPSQRVNFLLKSVLQDLKDMNYEINYPIYICKFFNNSDTLGLANIEDNEIFLNEDLFEKGKRELVLTLIEENEHILSKAEDKTRKFQNHLFNKLLTVMENTSGIFF